jgi:hypothetical protein
MDDTVNDEGVRDDAPPHQVLGNWLAATLTRWLYGVAVADPGPFRAVGRADVLSLEMREMTRSWSVDTIVQAAQRGFRHHEVPVRYRRRSDVSKIAGTMSGYVRAGWCILMTTVRHWGWTPAALTNSATGGPR